MASTTSNSDHDGASSAGPEDVTLVHLLEGGPPPVLVACQLLAQVADHVADAHVRVDPRTRAPQPRVHGALSAQAIVVTAGGHVQLDGFEVQSDDGPSPDDDVRALGALLYQVMTGRPPPALPDDPFERSGELFNLALDLSAAPEPLGQLLTDCLGDGDLPKATHVGEVLHGVAEKLAARSVGEWAGQRFPSLAPTQAPAVHPTAATLVPGLNSDEPEPELVAAPSRVRTLGWQAFFVVSLLLVMGVGFAAQLMVDRHLAGKDRLPLDGLTASSAGPALASAAPPAAQQDADGMVSLPPSVADLAPRTVVAPSPTPDDLPPQRVVVRVPMAEGISLWCGGDLATGTDAASIDDPDSVDCIVEAKLGDNNSVGTFRATSETPVSCVIDDSGDLFCG